MPVFDIIASAENNRYMEWQAMLFHYSCVTYQGAVPTIVVHKESEPLLPGFAMIEAMGGKIQIADNLRCVNDVCYPPRNSAVALQAIESDADFLVLCDADILFFKSMPFHELEIDHNTISFERVNFLYPDRPEYQPDIDDVFRNNGIDPSVIRNPVIDGGVPHVIPRHLHRRVGTEWLRCIDLFPIMFDGPRPAPNERHHADWPYRCYLASMWAMVMAKHTLALNHLETRMTILNYHDDKPMPEPSETEAGLLHYSYPTPGFDKRQIVVDACIDSADFWRQPEDDGTIGGCIRRQFVEAGRYYGLA